MKFRNVHSGKLLCPAKEHYLDRIINENKNDWAKKDLKW